MERSPHGRATRSKYGLLFEACVAALGSHPMRLVPGSEVGGLPSQAAFCNPVMTDRTLIVNIPVTLIAQERALKTDMRLKGEQKVPNIQDDQ